MLSDACFDLIHDIQKYAAEQGAIKTFIDAIDHYTAHTGTYRYPQRELDTLRRAAIEALEPEAVSDVFLRLLTLARQKKRKYDTTL
jgi:hypothetical protein